ncbi:type II CAAX prenyl endopeptidase Rce1 family protein [Lysinibacillus endophyticus]|uniref:CPBP family glutamic-type intramembrane protease n=1 Tax=Ureibacillus endophyticus TaxID=1978490 RepID=UPI00209CB30B|nr:CPBP family glutamic-type intramembrane protease [Lysinibacillus endophyticus]MCP1144753.1 CPBP family glutamic-type intramembrane protease [Lysinibacillus endophyticus]
MGNKAILLSLTMRTIFFLIFGLVIISVLELTGATNAMKEAEKWWPYQAILANIASFIVLRYFLKREGKSYNSILHFKKKKFGKDILKGLLYLLISFPFAAIGLYGVAYLVFGTTQPPTNMMQAIPLGAAVIALILFPLSNALVELPTYFGYAFPRIEKKWGSVALAIVLPALFLSLQHGPLPIVLGGDYMTWRLLAFIPLAFVVAFLFHKTRNITPLLIAHFVMDLQMVMYVLLAALGISVA